MLTRYLVRAETTSAVLRSVRETHVLITSTLLRDGESSVKIGNTFIKGTTDISLDQHTRGIYEKIKGAFGIVVPRVGL